MADDVLTDLAWLIVELGKVHDRLKAQRLADAAPKRCHDCGRPEQPWVPVLDPIGRTTGWRGPTCARRHDGQADRGGVQLPLEQEGADRG